MKTIRAKVIIIHKNVKQIHKTMKKIKKNIQYPAFNQLNVDLIQRGRWHFDSPISFPLYPHLASEVVRSNHYKYREEFSLSALVVIVVSGKLIYKVGEQDFLVTQGQSLIIPRHNNYSFENIAGHKYRKLIVKLKGKLADQIVGNLFGDFPVKISLNDPERCVEITRRIISLLSSNNETDAISGAGETLELLYSIAQSKKEKSKVDSIWKRAKEYLSPDQENLSIKQIAAKLGVSRSTLEKQFKKHYDLTLHEYRIQSRLEQAKNLLVNSKLSIKEIAALLQYSSPFHLSIEFKKRYGLSPYKWRTGTNKKA